MYRGRKHRLPAAGLFSSKYDQQGFIDVACSTDWRNFSSPPHRNTYYNINDDTLICK